MLVLMRLGMCQQNSFNDTARWKSVAYVYLVSLICILLAEDAVSLLTFQVRQWSMGFAYSISVSIALQIPYFPLGKGHKLTCVLVLLI